MDELEAYKNLRDCHLCAKAGLFSSCMHYGAFCEFMRNKALEEAAKVCEAGLYEADEDFLAKRGDEERVPYESGQAIRKSLAADIRNLRKTEQ